ncbi:MAG: hypothetical protein P8Z38_03110, partial [Robiginitalea sp.]
QNISGSGLSGTTLTIGIEDGTGETVDLSSLDESVVGANDITVTEAGGVYTVDYVDGDKDSTNEFNTGISFDGANLTVTDAGGDQTIDISSVSTDDQVLSLDAISNILTLEDGGTVNLTPYLDNTDDQLLSLDGLTNELTLEDGGSVDLTPYLDNTDDQTAAEVSYDNLTSGLTATDTQAAIDELAAGSTDDQNLTGATLTGTSLQIDIENGGSTTVDLSSLDESVVGTNDISVTESGGVYTVDYVDGDKDATNEIQTLTSSDGSVTLTPSGSDYDLSVAAADGSETIVNGGGINVVTGSGTSADPYVVTGTEVDGDITNEIQDLNLASDILTITNNGTATAIDLSPYLDNTDDQQITDFSLDGVTNILTLTLEDGGSGTVDLSAFASPDDQTLTLSGTILSIADGNDVDLSAFLDDQNLSTNGDAGNISIDNGNTLNLNVDDADADPTNEIQDLNLAGDILTVTNNGTATDIDLSPYLDNTDDQQITDFSLAANILTLTLEDGGTQTVDLSGFVSTDDQLLSLNGTTNELGIEDGNTVDLTPYLDNTDSQTLSTNGNAGDITISGGNNITLNVDDADADPANEIQTLISSD